MTAVEVEALVEDVRARVAHEAEALLRETAARLEAGDESLRTIEKTLQLEGRKLLAGIDEAALQTRGNGYRGAHRRCGCGGTLRYVADRTKHLVTLFGSVPVRRAYYHCAGCGRGEAPLDKALGVEGRFLTPAVQEMIAWADVELPYGRAEGFLRRTVGLRLRKGTYEAVARSLGAAVEATPLELPPDMAQRPICDFYLTMDGVKTRTLEGFKEPKLGAVFHARREQDGSPKRLATWYTAGLEEPEPFGERLWKLAVSRGLDRAQRVVVVGDGAPWIWGIAQFHFPQAVQIVDWYHAVEHLWELARLLWGPGSLEGQTWVKRREAELHNGRVDAVLRALRRLKPRDSERRDAVRQDIGYFTTNRKRMCYDRFRKDGYFIGSGVAEAGCKRLVAQRFKLSGMRWSRDGLLRLLHLRMCIYNDDWDRFADVHFPAAA
jgi:hypothetical protein